MDLSNSILGDLNDSLDIEFSQKLTIREIKVKGKYKTIVRGVDTYDIFKNEKFFSGFIKELKVKFGCACTISTEDNCRVLMFQGNHRDNLIREFKKEIPNVKIG